MRAAFAEIAGQLPASAKQPVRQVPRFPGVGEADMATGQLVGDAHERMLHQVLPDRGQVDDRHHPDRTREVGRPDSRMLKQRRAVEATTGNDDLVACEDSFGAALPVGNFHTDRTAILDEDSRDQRVGPHAQIGAASQGCEVGLGRAKTHPAVLVDLELSHAVLAGAVEIRVARDTSADQAVPGTAGAGHRQAPKLSGGASGGDAVGRAPAVEVPQQPGGELAPADPATRTRVNAPHRSGFVYGFAVYQLEYSRNLIFAHGANHQ